MENTNTHLIPFETQTWRKNRGQTLEDFHSSVNTHIQYLSENGYNVEPEWLDANGMLCETEKDMKISTICRILEKTQEAAISNYGQLEDLFGGQVEHIKNLKKNNRIQGDILWQTR